MTVLQSYCQCFCGTFFMNQFLYPIFPFLVVIILGWHSDSRENLSSVFFPMVSCLMTIDLLLEPDDCLH